MTITLEFEPDAEERLREIAKAEGKEIAAVVMESVEKRIRKANKCTRRRRKQISKEKWLAEFNA